MVAKLVIVPFDKSDAFQREKASGPEFVVQFNPESYTDTQKFAIAPTEPAHGDKGQEAKFTAEEPKKMSFEFVLDGTGVTPVPPPIGDANGTVPSTGNAVVDQINHFRETTGFTGEVHRPRFLMLIWGKLTFICVLESYTITYKLFTPDGLPLRALLAANFIEHKDPEVAEREKNLASPDIEHIHLVHETDVLTSVVDKIYRSPRHYVAVAEANGLNTLRRLETGTTLLLPPLR